MSANNGQGPQDSRQYLLHILASNPQVNQDQWLPILAKCFIESEERHEKLHARLFGDEDMQQKGFFEEIKDSHEKLDKDIKDLNKKIDPVVRFYKNAFKFATFLGGPIMVFLGWVGAWLKEHFKLH